MMLQIEGGPSEPLRRRATLAEDRVREGGKVAEAHAYPTEGRRIFGTEECLRIATNVPQFSEKERLLAFGGTAGPRTSTLNIVASCVQTVGSNLKNQHGPQFRLHVR